MFEFAILFSLKSYAIVIAASAVGGGVLGFLFGNKVEAKAQAEVAKASSAVSGITASVAKKL